MKNFTDLMVDITKDDDLAKECKSKISNSNNTELSAWFKTKGYDVDEAECKKLVDNKDQISASNTGIY